MSALLELRTLCSKPFCKPSLLSALQAIQFNIFEGNIPMWCVNEQRFVRRSLLQSSKISCVMLQRPESDHQIYSSLSLFVLPRGTRLPLHDHPNMHVLCHVLHGRLHAKCYDWLNDPTDSSVRNHREAKEVFFGSVPVGTIYQIQPDGGGVLHEFSAPEGLVAFLDVISPPYYAPPQHIECTYYDEVSPRRFPTPSRTMTIAPCRPQPEVPMDTYLWVH